MVCAFGLKQHPKQHQAFFLANIKYSEKVYLFFDRCGFFLTCKLYLFIFDKSGASFLWTALSLQTSICFLTAAFLFFEQKALLEEPQKKALLSETLGTSHSSRAVLGVLLCFRRRTRCVSEQQSGSSFSWARRLSVSQEPVCFRTAPQEWFVQEEGCRYVVLLASRRTPRTTRGSWRRALVSETLLLLLVLVFLSLFLRSSSCFRKEPTGSWGFWGEWVRVSFFWNTEQHQTTFLWTKKHHWKRRHYSLTHSPQEPQEPQEKKWCSVFQKEDIGGVLCFKKKTLVVFCVSKILVVFCVSEAPSLF